MNQSRFLSVAGHPFVQRLSNLRINFPVHNSEKRSKAISELRKRVEEGRDCWGYMVESLITNISLEERATTKDAVDLMRVCRRDIVDLYPKEQKRLTENAWNAVKQVKLVEAREPGLYNAALEAFNFQGVDFTPEQFLSDMRSHRAGPNGKTYEQFLVYHCRRRDVESALGFLEERSELQLPLNDLIASWLIYCHSSRGEYKEAHDIVQLLDKRGIYYGKSVPHAFVLGAANRGDIGRLTEYIDLYTPGDRVMLEALYELGKISPDQTGVILDRLPVHKSYLSIICRRAVKQLIELGQVDAAEQLVMKTEEVKENSSGKELVISISPSVLVLSEVLSSLTESEAAISKILSMQLVDPLIAARSIVILTDLAFRDPEKKSYCARTIKDLLKRYKKIHEPVAELLSQNVTRKIKEAETDNDVFLILKTTSDLGIKLVHLKEWNAALFKLISPDTEYNLNQLVTRIVSVRISLDCLTPSNGGVYSNSVLWSHIFKHLLYIKSELFFKAAAQVAKDLGVVYGPKRWYDSLGYNLYNTGDVKSYVDFLEVAYLNCLKRGDGEDYRQTTISILVAINVGKRHSENIDKLLEQVFDLIWERNLCLHEDIRNRIVNSVQTEMLAEIAKNLPVLGTENFLRARSSKVLKSSLKRNNRKVEHFE